MLVKRSLSFEKNDHLKGSGVRKMSQIQLLNMNTPKSQQPPERSMTPNQPRVMSPLALPPGRPSSLPPPEIHVEYESDVSEESVEVAETINDGQDSAKGQRHWLPAPADLRPKKLSRSASIVSFVQIPGETKMRMIVSPDGKKLYNFEVLSCVSTQDLR